jgi:Ribbon-helix-helix protein, copG family
MFINVVKFGERLKGCAPMKTKKGNANKKTKAQGAAQVRATISFPSDVYKSLETIAREKKVSLSWVVRDAAEKYIGGSKEGAV